jgi:hypothetical protein
MNSREREPPDRRTLRRGAGWLIEAGGLASLVMRAWRIA